MALAVRRVANDAEWGRMVPFLKKRTSWHGNCTVRVFVLDVGIVYSPGRNRKKKAMVSRSAMARVSGVCLFS